MRSVVVVLVTLCAALGFAPAYAGDSGRIGLRLLDTPEARRNDPRARVAIVDHLGPGATIHRRLLVTSVSPEPRRFQLYAAAAGVPKRRFVYAPGRTGNELTSWISFDRDQVLLPPYGEAVVRATIRVPPGAWQGERYGMLWAEATPRPGGDIRVVGRAGDRVYLNVGPGAEPPTDFRVEKLIALRNPKGRPVLRAIVHNTGRRAVDLTGRLRLTHGPGGLSAGPFEANRGVSLPPGGSGPVGVPLSAKLPVGPWQASIALASGHVHRKAEASVTFPNLGGSPIVSFTGALASAAFPRSGKIAGAAIAALAVTFTGAYLIRRRLQQTRRRETR